MNMARVLISLPEPLKAKLDALKRQGFTASGYIRCLLERELGDQPEPATKKMGRKSGGPNNLKKGDG